MFGIIFLVLNYDSMLSAKNKNASLKSGRVFVALAAVASC